MHAEQSPVFAQPEVAGDQEGGDVELGAGTEADQDRRQQQWSEFDGAAEVDQATDGRQGQADGRYHRWPHAIEQVADEQAAEDQGDAEATEDQVGLAGRQPLALQQGHRAGDHADDRGNHQGQGQVAGPELARAHAFAKAHAGQVLQFLAVSLGGATAAGNPEPQQGQRQQDQQIEQGEDDEGGAPVPLLDAPGHQLRNGGGGQPGAGQADRQGQAAIAVVPEAEQLGPGHGECAHANQRKDGEGQVQRPDRSLQLGGGQVAQRQHDQRGHRHAFHAEAQVEPADQLQGDHRAAEQEGDGHLLFALAPAEGLFQWHDQGAEAIEQRRIDTDGDADDGEQQDSPALPEFAEVD